MERKDDEVSQTVEHILSTKCSHMLIESTANLIAIAEKYKISETNIRQIIIAHNILLDVIADICQLPPEVEDKVIFEIVRNWEL